MRIKICGNREKESSLIVAKSAPDIMGWVFSPKSKRVISAESARKQIQHIRSLHASIDHWAVFAENSISQINEIVQGNNGFDAIQVVGTASFIQELRTKIKSSIEIVPAIRVNTNLLPAELDKYNPFDHCVVDAFVEGELGGTGKKIDPLLLEFLHRPFFLAGGLDAQNVVDCVNALKIKPMGVDVSSGVELLNCPGSKDPKLVNDFIQKVRHL